LTARGPKHHLPVDAAGIPLAISLTGGHRNDVPWRSSTAPSPSVADRAVRGCASRPWSPTAGCDHGKYRRALWSRGVNPGTARRATDHGSRLGKRRRVVERTLVGLHQLRGVATQAV
jgi:hypothetical protein